MLGTAEKSTYFTKLKAGGRFAIYAFGIYLAATFTIGYLGIIIRSPLLTLPLAMLISHPIIWVVTGVVLAAAYKVAVKPLYRLIRNGKRTLKEEKSEEKVVEPQKSPKGQEQNANTPDRDSGIVPGSEPNSRNSSRRNSDASEDSGFDVGPRVVTYNTTGDGNCFFHAVFGEKKDGSYRAERAQEMRLEWHKFLSQFDSLDDHRMDDNLVGSMRGVFSMFLDEKLQNDQRIQNIIKSNEEIKKAYNNLEQGTINDISFYNVPELYKAYLNAIKEQSYYVFIEEIPILASLANIKITVHYKNNNNDLHTTFDPNPEMTTILSNLDEPREPYQGNSELWGNKKEETVYLHPGHYERAEVLPSSRTGSISLNTSSPSCIV